MRLHGHILTSTFVLSMAYWLPSVLSCQMLSDYIDTGGENSENREKLAKRRIKLSYFTGGCWQSAKNQQFFVGNAQGHARLQSLRSGESRGGSCMLKGRTWRNSCNFLCESTKTKNQRAENLYGCESEESRACKSGALSNYLLILGEKWLGRRASANAISPLPADKGQDSDFLQDPLGKLTAIPRWRRLRGEIMRHDGLK